MASKISCALALRKPPVQTGPARSGGGRRPGWPQAAVDFHATAATMPGTAAVAAAKAGEDGIGCRRVALPHGSAARGEAASSCVSTSPLGLTRRRGSGSPRGSVRVCGTLARKGSRGTGAPGRQSRGPDDGPGLSVATFCGIQPFRTYSAVQGLQIQPGYRLRLCSADAVVPGGGMGESR